MTLRPSRRRPSEEVAAEGVTTKQIQAVVEDAVREVRVQLDRLRDDLDDE